jgi:hypothetical protein
MLTKTSSAKETAWPALPLAEWKGTYATLHMWSQIIGKIPLALSPRMNHWWQVALYVTVRGLSTSPIPYSNEIFQIELDLVEHRVLIETSWGQNRMIGLYPRSVADFYHEFMDTLHNLGIEVKIWPMPVEIPDPIRFDQDFTHASYDPEYANRFWRILVTIDTIFKEFRADFIGKASPSHFFWGSFDHCVTRFSGRTAPERPGADPITKEAYSHEVISAGFWPGSGSVTDAAFYCYAAPEPAQFAQSRIKPDEAFYHGQLHEFILMYDDVRTSVNPKETLLEFLQSTYDAGATLANWDRKALERQPPAD